VKLLLVGRSLVPGSDPGASLLLRLAAAWRDEHDLGYVSGWTDDRGALPPGALGVRLRGLGRFGDYRLLRSAIRTAVQRHRPDVVLLDSPDLPVPPVPAVCLVRRVGDSVWRSEQRPTVSLRGRGIRRIDRIVVPCWSTRRALLDHGVSGWRVEHIPDLLPPTGEPSRRSAVGLRLLHPGAIEPEAGQHLSVDAIRRLPERLQRRVCLTLSGSVSNRRYLAQLKVAAAGLPVEFVLDSPPDWGSADAVLYPTAVPEWFPEVVVQAMHARLPVMLTEHPALRELTGGRAWFAAPENAASLRGLILRALDNPGGLADLAESGHAHISDLHDDRVVLQRWRELLSAVAR